jgi:hypothetical protein
VRETGPSGKRKRERENGPARGKERPKGEERSRLGWSAARVAFLFPSLFLFQTNSNLFEFKSNLNSNSYALTPIKLMHRHECTNMLN